uniref:Tn7-like element transposition protein TnsE n=1 Tax=Vibrio cholerae TaxID=666 RepID=UPI003F58A145
MLQVLKFKHKCRILHEETLPLPKVGRSKQHLLENGTQRAIKAVRLRYMQTDVVLLEVDTSDGIKMLSTKVIFGSDARDSMSISLLSAKVWSQNQYLGLTSYWMGCLVKTVTSALITTSTKGQRLETFRLSRLRVGRNALHSVYRINLMVFYKCIKLALALRDKRKIIYPVVNPALNGFANFTREHGNAPTLNYTYIIFLHQKR